MHKNATEAGLGLKSLKSALHSDFHISKPQTLQVVFLRAALWGVMFLGEVVRRDLQECLLGCDKGCS